MDFQRRNEIFHSELGAMIRAQRESLAFSLEQVARDSDCGLSRSALSLIELGEQQIYAYQLFELAKTLRFSIEEYFQKIEKKIIEEEHPEMKKML